MPCRSLILVLLRCVRSEGWALVSVRMRKSVWGVMSVRIMLSFGPCFAWNSPLMPPTFWHEIEIEGMEGGGRGLCGPSAPGLLIGPCIVEIDCIVIKEVQYQFEVNRCRNEDIIVKGNFGWAWPMWACAPGLVMGPCIVEINRIVIREVQYQFEVNRCRNEEIIVKGNFGWAWPMWAGCPRVGNGAMHS